MPLIGLVFIINALLSFALIMLPIFDGGFKYMREFESVCLFIVIVATGITAATIGHYAETWLFSYLLSGVFAALFAIAFKNIPKNDAEDKS